MGVLSFFGVQILEHLPYNQKDKQTITNIARMKYFSDKLFQTDVVLSVNPLLLLCNHNLELVFSFETFKLLNLVLLQVLKKLNQVL